MNRKTFLTLPKGTIYAKGVQWAFDGLTIKGESFSNDWYYTDPAWIDANDSVQALDRLDAMLKDGLSFPSDTAEGRDGLFDEDAVFLIFERSDLDVLRKWIDRAIALPPVP